MNAPDERAFEKAFARKLCNLARSLELLARAGRPTIPTNILREVWAAQLALYRAGGPYPWPPIPEEL